MHIQTLQTISTDYPADSVEWCTNSNFLEYFACGTYLLNNNDETNNSTGTQCRKGRLYLYKYLKENDTVLEMFRKETEGILDMRWLDDKSNSPILAVANAIGGIEVYCLENDQLVLNATYKDNKTDYTILALSLDWLWCDDNYRIVVSDSKGDIFLLDYNKELGNLSKVSSWSAHNFEAWICASDKWNRNIIYTGGDDTCMYAFDIRDPLNVSKVGVNKSHNAGVTCFLSHPFESNKLLTGSYDEHLRTFDTRSLKQPISDVNLKGGVWRIKTNLIHKDLILCACMYNNFSIVRCVNDELKLVEEYKEHKSICYGADWCGIGNDENLVMATCSFYDNKLCISKVSCK